MSNIKKKNKINKSTKISKKRVAFQNPGHELKRVAWPTKQHLLKSTVVILVILIISTLYIMGLDLLFSNAFKALKELY